MATSNIINLPTKAQAVASESEKPEQRETTGIIQLPGQREMQLDIQPNEDVVFYAMFSLFDSEGDRSTLTMDKAHLQTYLNMIYRLTGMRGMAHEDAPIYANEG